MLGADVQICYQAEGDGQEGIAPRVRRLQDADYVDWGRLSLQSMTWSFDLYTI